MCIRARNTPFVIMNAHQNFARCVSKRVCHRHYVYPTWPVYKLHSKQANTDSPQKRKTRKGSLCELSLFKNSLSLSHLSSDPKYTVGLMGYLYRIHRWASIIRGANRTIQIPIHVIMYSYMNTYRYSVWNLPSLSLNMHSLYTLSLIHIWRCRRYAVCRSRWSPEH